MMIEMLEDKHGNTETQQEVKMLGNGKQIHFLVVLLIMKLHGLLNKKRSEEVKNDEA